MNNRRMGFLGRMGLMGIMAAGLALLAAGCVSKVVPQTKITGSIGGKPFSLSTPKDSDLQGFEISAGTNGEVRVRLEKLTARTNPDVITQSGAAQAAIVEASGNVFEKGVAAGVKAAAGAVVPGK